MKSINTRRDLEITVPQNKPSTNSRTIMLLLVFPLISSCLAYSQETIVTLSAKATIPDGQIALPGTIALNALLEEFKYTEAELIEMKKEAAAYFTNRFKIPIAPGNLSDLASIQFQGDWVFSPFVFKPQLNYHIAAHPNPACLNTNVTASGFSITSKAATTTKLYGALPASTTFIYGRYLWHGDESKGCPRQIVTALSALPIVMNSLGYRAEEYDVTHEKYGSGMSHIAAIFDKPTGRFEIWTTLQFLK